MFLVLNFFTFMILIVKLFDDKPISWNYFLRSMFLLFLSILIVKWWHNVCIIVNVLPIHFVVTKNQQKLKKIHMKNERKWRTPIDNEPNKKKNQPRMQIIRIKIKSPKSTNLVFLIGFGTLVFLTEKNSELGHLQPQEALFCSCNLGNEIRHMGMCFDCLLMENKIRQSILKIVEQWSRNLRRQKSCLRIMPKIDFVFNNLSK